MPLSLIDYLALFVFIACWIGYTYFARQKAKTTNCIARCLHQHRIHWMNELIRRDFRVADTALLANLERNIAFFASTTLLVLAGVLTLFSQVDKLESVIASFSYALYPNHFAIQLKLTLLALIFTLAFFQFTWSMRQYGFLNVMVGAAPVEKSGENTNLQEYAMQMAVVQDQAAHSYNYGLRSYYFSLAALTWFFHPALFVFSSLLVVYTLYNREFKSKAVRAITKGQACLSKHEQN
jgi:uncharacterized membrane protein